ncbi:Protein sidekick-1 [Varanus komodoensis]|nr:Protein sidekick-1 [Varanus komodoensis]
MELPLGALRLLPSRALMNGLNETVPGVQDQAAARSVSLGKNRLLARMVGVIGEEEEWVTLCEVEKESDAQLLEIPNLTPYTHYRFRMRQVNIVGQSPLSQPSRVIQTLQAPPDVAPGSVTVRTASETSLWVRWVPLPDTQYNGNPESVGYRIKYWSLDTQSPVLTKVISDRLEREHTIEDLEEWTEYELQIQAFNAIGAGPWSEVVRGRTRESVFNSEVPSAPPENVSAEAVSSTQILLTWAAVPEAEQNGLILGYKVLFRAKDAESKLSSQVVRGNLSLSVLLAGLRKYVLYEIQVLAFTRIGDGVPSSPPVLERTKDDAPGPPVRLVFPEVRLTSVRIVWQPPEEPNGILLACLCARLRTTNTLRGTKHCRDRTGHRRFHQGLGAMPMHVLVNRSTHVVSPSKPAGEIQEGEGGTGVRRRGGKKGCVSLNRGSVWGTPLANPWRSIGSKSSQCQKLVQSSRCAIAVP